jgi:SAM-dependent methyltransferase
MNVVRRYFPFVTQGRIEIRVGDVASLELEPAAFDRIFSVHCVYFWRDLDAVLGKLAAGLRPAGKLVLAFRPESDDIPARFRDATYRFPRSEEVEGALERHGLARVSTSESSLDPHCVLVRASKRA